MTPLLLAAAAALSTPLSPSDLAALDLARGEVQALALPAAPAVGLAVDVVLDGALERLELAPHSMRGAGFRVLASGPDGGLVPVEVAAPRTVRGTVAGRPGSWVAGALEGGRLEALVSLGDGRLFGVQPAPGAVAAAGALAHVAYEADDLVPPPGLCATPDLPTAERGLAPPATPQGAASFRVCEVACDADFEFYGQNGSSVDATVKDIEKILIGVEAIYGTEVEVLYEIGTILVRTSEPDPYSSTDPSTLLQQFDSHWSLQQGAIQRDIAHLFTGKNLDGSVIGIARLNAICSQTNGYGLSQSKYTSSLVLRTRLTAHELGHNWSAGHCNGEADCGIMCQGGCGSPTEFGATSTASILQEKATSGCLAPLTAAPVLTAVTGTPDVWSPVPLTLSGSDLFTATAVTVDGLPAAELTVVDDLTLEFVPPLPTALGDAGVSVTTPLGTSNEVTITFTDTDPPQLDAPANPGWGQVETWRYAGKAGSAALLVFGFADTTIPVAGIDLLFPDTLVSVGNLDPLGLGELTFQFPALPIFTFVYSQLVTVQGSTVKASGVQTSIVFI